MSLNLEKFLPWVEWRLEAFMGIKKNIRIFGLDSNFGIVYDENIARYTRVTAPIRWCQLLLSIMNAIAVAPTILRKIVRSC